MIAFISACRGNLSANENDRRHRHLWTRATILAACKGLTVWQVQGVFDGESEQSIAILGDDEDQVQHIARMLAAAYEQDAIAYYWPINGYAELWTHAPNDWHYTKEYTGLGTLDDRAPERGDYSYIPCLTAYLVIHWS